jgi:hypothetical protein
VKQVDSADDIGFDYILRGGPVLVQETIAQTAAGIGDQVFDGTTFHGRDDLVHPRFVRKIRLQGFDVAGA